MSIYGGLCACNKPFKSSEQRLNGFLRVLPPLSTFEWTYDILNADNFLATEWFDGDLQWSSLCDNIDYCLPMERRRRHSKKKRDARHDWLVLPIPHLKRFVVSVLYRHDCSLIPFRNTTAGRPEFLLASDIIAECGHLACRKVLLEIKRSPQRLIEIGWQKRIIGTIMRFCQHGANVWQWRV